MIKSESRICVQYASNTNRFFRKFGLKWSKYPTQLHPSKWEKSSELQFLKTKLHSNILEWYPLSYLFYYNTVSCTCRIKTEKLCNINQCWHNLLVWKERPIIVLQYINQKWNWVASSVFRILNPIPNSKLTWEFMHCKLV